MTSVITEAGTVTGDAAESAEKLFGLNRPISEARKKATERAGDILKRAFNGDRRAHLELRESLTTSDLFRSALGDALNQELLAAYEAALPVWQQYAFRTTVKDFKPKTLVDLLGGRAALPIVPELTPYPARSTDHAEYPISVGKFGARFALSWESIVNDDLDELSYLPGQLAQSARDTEDRTAAGLLTDGAGPNGGFFTADNGNLLAGNPALNADGLTAALTATSGRVDEDGNPIVVTSSVLVVPPALEIPALQILNATELRLTQGGTTTVTGNYLAGRVKLVVNPWLPVVDKGAAVNTTWYLLPAPTVRRPAVAMAFLRGHEQPDLRIKGDTGSRVGGGGIDPAEGSFEIDDVQYRVRHVTGGATVDPMATVASTGAGA